MRSISLSIVILLSSLCAVAGQGVVTGFSLINADTNEEIFGLMNGDHIHLSETGTSLSVRADTVGVVGSVVFELDGKPALDQTENVQPWSLSGDTNGDYSPVPRLSKVGTHTITATPYLYEQAQGTRGATLVLTIEVIDVTSPPAPPISAPSMVPTKQPTDSSIDSMYVESLSLIDANTNLPIGASLQGGSTINLSVVGAALNMRANVVGNAGSVKFQFDDNQNYHTENVAPYALFQDSGGDYNSGSFSVGEHTVTAIPFEGAGASQAAGGALSVTFTVVDSAALPAPIVTEQPTPEPTPWPTDKPEAEGVAPTDVPTPESTPEPTPSTWVPTIEPTPEPSGEPTPEPTRYPTLQPTPDPTPEQTPEPTPDPTSDPTPEPTPSTWVPTVEPTPEPTGEPTPEPTPWPTPDPTPEPTPTTLIPTQETPAPTPEPTPWPTPDPTPEPTADPTPWPTPEPTPWPTADPTPWPTPEPTPWPTPDPTWWPTPEPTPSPTPDPTWWPTPMPTPWPTPDPTWWPTPEPTPWPTPDPTWWPTPEPTPWPTFAPTPDPTPYPTPEPTPEPTPWPTPGPSTMMPSAVPTKFPTAEPTPYPTPEPTPYPSRWPTPWPTQWTPFPTPWPTSEPTPEPTPWPTPEWTPFPTPEPTSPSVSNSAEFGLQSSCHSNDESKYSMCLDLNLVDISLQDAQAFINAKNKWESVIMGDLPQFGNAPSRLGAAICNGMPDVLDDTYICGSDEPIDGVGGVLGFAGPYHIRKLPGTTNPKTGKNYWISITGVMKFDSSDVPGMVQGDLLEGVILHEMGHVLGIGTLWTYNTVFGNGLHVTDSPEYATGTHAQYEWEQLTQGCTYSVLPVEQDGGPGTKDGHYDEACMRHELMTGWITGSEQPLSRMTVGTLQDMGYEVNYNAADPMTLDDLDLDACGIQCPGYRRERFLKNTKEDAPPPPLSKGGRSAINAFARKQMEQIRQENKERRTAETSEDDLIFVGGDLISVVYMENTTIYEITVGWEEVKNMYGG